MTSGRQTEIDQLLERAARARSDAEGTQLENVREQCLRAEAAWLEMADRASRTAALRQEQAAEKATRPPYVIKRRRAVAEG